jgi:AcrR family transcriptional regulator
MGTGREDGPARLPAGRHGLSREFVVESQRDRVLDAMANACAEKGYATVTVTDVTQRARVSRSTFYELFRDLEDCFLAAYDVIYGKFLTAGLTAYQRDLDWPKRVRAALEAMLEFMAAEPAFARMCMVEPLAAGPAAVERYLTAVNLISTLLDEGRGIHREAEKAPASLAKGIVSGAALVIREQILSGETERLPDLLPEILYPALVPFLGQREALREATAAGPFRSARELSAPA